MSATRRAVVPAAALAAVAAALAGTPASVVAAAPAYAQAPAVVFAAEPRAFQVVAVPVPGSLRRRAPVTYAVRAGAATPMLSAAAGTLEDGAAELLLTLGVPRGSRAGRVRVAVVRFRAGAPPAVDVPLEADVARVDRIELAVPGAVTGVRAGDEAAVAYRLSNLGNAPAEVEVEVVAPARWRVRSESGMATLDVHGVAEGAVRVAVPAAADPGAAVLRLVARRGGEPAASADVTVEVAAAPREAAGLGPVLTLGSATVAGPWDGKVTALSASLEGEAAPGVRVSGRASRLPARDDGSRYGLARAGYFPATPSLLATSAGGRLGLGLTGARLSELTGPVVTGRGVSAEVTRAGWSAAALAARPSLGGEAAPGGLLGARAEVRAGPVLLSAAASSLAEERFDPRRLDAVSAGAALPELLGARVGAEVAERRWDGGRGMGWAATLSRRGPRDNLDVRAVHAPGGAGAFARAADELTASGGRALGRRVSVHGAFWRTRDEGGAAFHALAADGWSLGGQLQAGRGVALGLETRRSAFDAASDAGGFGSAERGVGASASLRSAAWYGMASGFLGGAERTARAAGGARLRESAPRSQLWALAGRDAAGGTLELGARLEQNAGGIGVLPWQAELSARAERVPLLRGRSARLLGEAAVRRRSWFGDRAPITELRAGLTAELPRALTVGLAAERDPFVLVPGTGDAWMIALHVERAFRLPRLGERAFRGVVYRDVNANGARDRGEPGLGGIVVRRAGETAVTDADGAFRFAEPGDAAAEIDARSLPLGSILAPHGAARAGELGVVDVSPIEVHLALAAADAERVPASALEKVLVTVRDADGRTWIARRSDATTAVFDALPPGRYTVEIDASDAAEPLRAESALPGFVVGGGAAPVRLELVLRARPLRIRRLDGGGDVR
ncbi:MAG TPA: hypothetical protein VFQ38_05055 [Longimicrobiales bacterium]|nr:hypothetical protein [Longimicrobiales bacterium]